MAEATSPTTTSVPHSISHSVVRWRCLPSSSAVATRLRTSSEIPVRILFIVANSESTNILTEIFYPFIYSQKKNHLVGIGFWGWFPLIFAYFYRFIGFYKKRDPWWGFAF